MDGKKAYVRKAGVSVRVSVQGSEMIEVWEILNQSTLQALRPQ
jgi:hypothetical protein